MIKKTCKGLVSIDVGNELKIFLWKNELRKTMTCIYDLENMM